MSIPEYLVLLLPFAGWLSCGRVIEPEACEDDGGTGETGMNVEFGGHDHVN